MSDYNDILNRARSEIPEPVDVPAGTWKLQAISGKYTEETEETEEDGLMATGLLVFKPIEPGSDVDDEAIAEFADSAASARIFHRFWLRDLRDVQQLNRIFDAMGMSGDGTIKQSVATVKGYEVMAYVYQKPDDVGESRQVKRVD